MLKTKCAQLVVMFGRLTNSFQKHTSTTAIFHRVLRYLICTYKYMYRVKFKQQSELPVIEFHFSRVHVYFNLKRTFKYIKYALT